MPETLRAELSRICTSNSHGSCNGKVPLLDRMEQPTGKFITCSCWCHQERQRLVARGTPQALKQLAELEGRPASEQVKSPVEVLEKIPPEQMRAMQRLRELDSNNLMDFSGLLVGGPAESGTSPVYAGITRDEDRKPYRLPSGFVVRPAFDWEQGKACPTCARSVSEGDMVVDLSNSGELVHKSCWYSSEELVDRAIPPRVAPSGKRKFRAE